MAHDIFISYAEPDKLIADAVCAGLEQKGLRCWYAARDVRKGENATEATNAAVESSRLLVLIFTEYANGSPNVLREVCSAADNRIPIQPFRLTGIQPADNLTFFLGGANWLDAVGKDAQKSVGQLAGVCEQRLKGIPASSGKSSGKAVKAVAALLALAVLAFAGFRLFGPGSAPDDGDPEKQERPGDQMTALLGDMDCASFEASFAESLAEVGADATGLELRFYDEAGDPVTGNSPFTSVELFLPEPAAAGISKEDLILCARAMIQTAFSCDDAGAVDKLAERLLGSYDTKELAINESAGGYRLFCNYSEKGGKLTIEPF